MARHKSRGPKRTRVVLDEPQVHKVDPRVLERVHRENEPAWVRRLTCTRRRGDEGRGTA